MFFKNYFDENEWKVYTKLIKEGTIKTASMGRLFDAVAFVLGFKNSISFEGEAGMYVEKLAKEALSSTYSLSDYLEHETITDGIPTKKLFQKIIESIQTNDSLQAIALNFHFTLVKCIEKVAANCEATELAFSGGVFQNTVLIDLIINNLKYKYNLHFHEILSPNDENIAFGQLSYYINILKN